MPLHDNYICGETIDAPQKPEVDWGNVKAIFDCRIESLEIDGGGMNIMVVSHTTFFSVDWYWASLGCVEFVKCTFERCVFRGGWFASSAFFECRFVECRFLQDNVGGDCEFENAEFYGTVFDGCENAPEVA